jgi:hypothetical protein
MEGVTLESIGTWTNMPPTLGNTLNPTPDLTITVENDNGNITVNVDPNGTVTPGPGNTIVVTVPAPGIDAGDWVEVNLPPNWTYQINPGVPGTVIITPPPGYTVGGTYPNITVTAPTTLTVSTNSLNFIAPGQTLNVTVTTNATTWGVTIPGTAGWLTYSITGNVIAFTAAENTAAAPRSTSVTVAGNPTQTITVTQAAAGANLIVVPETWTAAQGGDETSIAVTANVAWTVSSDAGWLTFVPGAGTNNGSIILIAAANNTTTQRVGTITVTDGTIEATVVVTQPGTARNLVVNALTASVGAAANSDTTVGVTSNIAWTATTNQAWLSVTPSGTGDGTLTITATAANPNTTTRTATVTVTSNDGGAVISQTITVTQAAAPRNLQVGSTTANVAYVAGSSTTVGVTANIGWSASTPATWLTIAPNSGSAVATMSFTATVNPTAAPRTATVTVVSTDGGTEISRTITVTQAGNPNILDYVVGGRTPQTVLGNTPWLSNSFIGEVDFASFVPLNIQRLGSVLLSDILVDTNMTGLTLSSTDPRFCNTLFTIGNSPDNAHTPGQPAILFGFFITLDCLDTWGWDVDTVQYPIELTLTRGGASLTITMHANFSGTGAV